MQPFVAAEHVKQSYRRFIQTSFPLRREPVRRRFEDLIENERLLWRDPFVSLSRPFAPGTTFDELTRQKVVGPDIGRPKWGFPSLFAHQVAATRRLSTLGGTPKNTIVATGTGSGKTEAFLVPIVDDCLRHPNPAGVRAVILYPMNALANDQLKRLRATLAGTGVTFARFTGDTPESDQATRDKKSWLPRPAEAPKEERYYRNEIRESPPQILLTNYTMLEFLLLRKREQEIFHGVKPRYLVLDEVHTYTGILGAEVACLIRRLKEHAGVEPGELVCVGTSATVKSSGGGGGSASELAGLARFATELFGEEFGEDAIVEERYTGVDGAAATSFGPLPNLRAEDIDGFDPDDAAAVAKLYRKLTGRSLLASGAGVYDELFDAIRPRREFIEVEQIFDTPKPLGDVLAAMRKWPGREGASDEALRLELTAIFLLGCSARLPGSTGDHEPRFRPKVHLQMRSLAPLNQCLACDSLLTDGRVECSDKGKPHDTTRLALGLGVCRSCGQDYLLGRFVPPKPDASKKAKTPQKVKIGKVGATRLSASETGDSEDVATMYLLPEHDAPPVEGEDQLTDEKFERRAVCSACLESWAVEQDRPPGRCTSTDCPEKGKADVRVYWAFLSGARCPLCQGQGRGRRPQVITPMRSGAAASVSVLTQSLMPELSAAKGEQRDEKKVLIFADSRQDTAHQAGFLRDRHQAYTQRQIVFRVLREMHREGKQWVALAGGSGEAVLASEVFLRTRARYGEAEAMNLLTPVEIRGDTDMGFYGPDEVIPPYERDKAIACLRWDLAVEFSERSDSRNSLEREGLTTVRYSGIEETAAMILKECEHAAPAWTQPLVTAILDTLRRNKAVDYAPFQDYLGAGADSVKRKEARPTRQTRMPIGWDADKHYRSRAFDIKAWYSAEGKGVTAVANIVERVAPHLDLASQRALIDKIVEVCIRRKHLRQVDIGRKMTGSGKLTRRAYQLNEKHIEIGTGGDRFRCDACGRTYGFQLVPANSDRAICASYRCKGRLKTYTPDVVDNFYVRLYTQQEPERLCAAEHSGQLSGEERVILEEKFKKGEVNALVCTPTLELGVNIGDLVALVMRNIPPTPSNYSQRAGRAGRQKKIALILSHAGQGPHDSYFFDRPEEMIVGAIRTPTFLLDNRVVIDRHINSLILEKLDTKVPGAWEEIRTIEGALRDEVIQPLADELAHRLGTIQAAVAHAFIKERNGGSLTWLDEAYVRSRIDAFPDKLRRGLDHWCARYRETYGELQKLRSKVRATAQEMDRERKLRAALDTLELDPRYYPLSYLQSVGVLPRYGFPGDQIVVRDAKQREIAQAAAVGIREFAPGNTVYVAGRKIRVNRISFSGGTSEDPRNNADTYRYCPNCNFISYDALAQECAYCREVLSTGRCLKFEAARGMDLEYIGQEDEYRDRSSYDAQEYLIPREGTGVPGAIDRDANGWKFHYSRLRQIEIFNRGRFGRDGSVEPFKVCLECGVWQERLAHTDDADEDQPAGSRHEASCNVSTWDASLDDRVENALHLKASFQGDVVQVEISPLVAGEDGWLETFPRALLLGLQLELYVNPREVGYFARRWRDDSGERTEIVFYDSMPGGTGYLKRLVDDLPLVARRAAEHMKACSCESACYRCLKDFWNQRVHDRLDKRRILAAMETIAASTAAAAPVTPAEDVRFESFLEARFYDELRKAGLPLPQTQKVVRSPDGRYIVRADFVYETPPIVVLTDGRAYHASDVFQVIADIEKRNELEFAGKRLLEFTYSDVIERPGHVVATMQAALGAGSRAREHEAGVMQDGLPADRVAAAFCALLCKADPRLTAMREIRLANDSIMCIAVDAATRRVVALVDPQVWVSDAAAWCRALQAHGELRASGWRLVRVPQPWLDSPEGAGLARRIAGMS